MSFLRSVLLFALFSGVAMAYDAPEGAKSEHRAEVYVLARDYIERTFNLDIVEESEFSAIRMNSKGLWGDFNARVRELGQDWFEVQGWCIATGQPNNKVRWSVVLQYRLDDPDAWKYQRLDTITTNDPIFTSWKFGGYKSVPYIAEAGAIPEDRLSDWSKILPGKPSEGEG